MKKVVIVGCNLSGLRHAKEILSKKGFDVVVVETPTEEVFFQEKCNQLDLKPTLLDESKFIDYEPILNKKKRSQPHKHKNKRAYHN